MTTYQDQKLKEIARKLGVSVKVLEQYLQTKSYETAARPEADRPFRRAA